MSSKKEVLKHNLTSFSFFLTTGPRKERNLSQKDPLYRKPALVFGPLEHLTDEDQHATLRFYNQLADVFAKQFQVRGHVVTDRMDPKTMDATIRDLFRNKNTSILVLAITAPLWGDGVIAEIAHRNDVDIVVLKHTKQKTASLLLGNPSVVKVLSFNNFDDGIHRLQQFLHAHTSAESF